MDNAPLRNGYGIDTWYHWWIRRISRKSNIQKDRTMEKINEVLKDYARVLEEALVDGILQEGLLKTGELGRSVRVNYDERKEVFSIKMEDYGYYQDSGVHGIERRQPKNPESLFNPGQFRSYVIGGRAGGGAAARDGGGGGRRRGAGAHGRGAEQIGRAHV